MNSLLKSIISSSLYLLILFVVELITYKTGFISERHDAFWHLYLFIALVVFNS